MCQANPPPLPRLCTHEISKMNIACSAHCAQVASIFQYQRRVMERWWKGEGRVRHQQRWVGKTRKDSLWAETNTQTSMHIHIFYTNAYLCVCVCMPGCGPALYCLCELLKLLIVQQVCELHLRLRLAQGILCHQLPTIEILIILIKMPSPIRDHNR